MLIYLVILYVTIEKRFQENRILSRLTRASSNAVKKRKGEKK